MTPWIKKINPQGGALSSADNPRTYYIPKVAAEVHGAVSVFLEECRKNNEKLCIIVDESTDQRERQILNVLVRIGDKALLLESVFLHEPANHANVAAAVNDAIIVHQLRECVFFLITDNTAYCKKAYSDILHEVSIPSFPTSCFRFEHYSVRKKFLLFFRYRVLERVGYLYECSLPLENFEIDKFWEGKKSELPLMWKASRSLWTPASAADVEKSFSILTLLDSPKSKFI